MATDAPAPNEGPQLERTVLLTGVDLASFLGHRDQLIADLEQQHPAVSFHARDHVLTLRGPAAQVRAAEQVVGEVLEVARRSGAVSRHDVREVTRMVERGDGPTAAQVLSEPILSVRGNAIRPQTAGQRSYVDAIDQNTIVFGIGPAGTGKTYLAMAKAVQALQRREVAKIILTRPAVEAGERLGYLPGSLEDKIDPYLRPLFDAVGSMMDQDLVPRLLANGTIEVAPLAYMRGRTLNESFVILDEAQNTTPEQMKMFLTRLGYGSKMVVTGDVTQVDLPIGTSGLRLMNRILRGVDDIHFAELSSDDIVRHSLVGRIVDAYSAYEEARAANRDERKGPAA
ncbi:phosphate starvation-inducible protein PhoH [Leucobacter sp. OLJS4]|uniref:PhoH family protein n=1 Tax=unclassified Leucobacter TaxID=2621730 RepID=UPI000C195C1D|nr:phosphate starvation-inducible protein PhoH [Leucobacter sp. OLCALW19]PII86307.1 phosphate starvation-inducible protein PhoH [Leucobacter sp. OLTLW20]PII90202.1 phosphate starvation-inducible protein PhoH [Leucobacter sp. OLAS13]PII96619.1 phosphate starvation-inducible protein PhoH [Leucobacter sp. OLCS4]PII97235.1 phosphate starvation-inducible protein PhoH [Leucobacter sp. OLDS2]PIJ02071.1 phosphate starvation-inducible protein PhoH [Leucobacter sp. OLIS6]PIJ12594.1 phosphate starvation